MLSRESSPSIGPSLEATLGTGCENGHWMQHWMLDAKIVTRHELCKISKFL